MKRVLVALDGSPAQDHVLAAALEIVSNGSGKLTLFRAVGAPTEMPAEVLSVAPADVPKILLARAEADLARLAKIVPASAFESAHAEIGTPWRAIIDAAGREHADVIVIGSHGYGGLDRLLGTTAAKVVDHAGCSVLVARPPR